MVKTVVAVPVNMKLMMIKILLLLKQMTKKTSHDHLPHWILSRGARACVYMFVFLLFFFLFFLFFFWRGKGRGEDNVLLKLQWRGYAHDYAMVIKRIRFIIEDL